MKVLILGQNKINKCVSDYLKAKGCESRIVEDIYSIRRCKGQIGDFSLELKNESVSGEYVIVTEQPRSDVAAIDGGQVKHIADENKVQNLSKKDRLSPIVFILDYFAESSMSATIGALRDAAEIANKKRRVYYLAKFVRTAGHEVERLYSDARNAGVTFIKYEDLSISYNDDDMGFMISVTDGVMDVEIETKSIYADGDRNIGDRFSILTDKLNLWPDEKGYLVEDRFFLSPVLTSRNGIFHITKDIEAEKLESGLEYIFSAMNCPSEKIDQRAVIDEEKCVFCYTCYRACPHGAMDANPEVRAMKNLDLACQGCGICASVCPGNAITLSGEKIEKPSANKKDKTLLFCCENSAEIAINKIMPELGEISALIEVVPVPCGGRIGFEQLSDALKSYGNVMAAVCMDDACRHFDGNKRACRQKERVANMLETMNLPSDKVQFVQVSHAMPVLLKDVITGFVRGEAK